MSERRPVTEIAPPEVLTRINEEMATERDGRQKNPTEVERELRARVDAYLLEVFHRTQHETSRRWTFEQEVKRPYYHVNELDEPQLANWNKYLDFEESEPDNFVRTRFLYERCLVTAANYDEFWFRYARWMRGQVHLDEQVRNEEVRNIYSRASCVYVFTDSPEIRLHYARFEESLGKPDIAVAIHEAVLNTLPGHLETIISLVNTHRRQFGIDAAIEVLNQHVMSQGYNPYVRGALVAELARLTWKAKGDVAGARKIFEENSQWFSDCRKFWFEYLLFERDLPVQMSSDGKAEEERYTRLKKVYDAIRSTAKLDEDTTKELSGIYLEDLELRGGEKAMKEWVRLDGEIWGPASVQGAAKASEPAQEVATKAS
jgi:pre-mRNA-processing factor 39